MDLDSFQMKLGGLSWYEIRTFVFVNVAVLAGGYAGQLAVVFSAVPQFRCNLTTEDGQDPAQNMTDDAVLKTFVPYSQEKQLYERCYHYPLNSSTSNGTVEVDWEPCGKGYVYSDEYYYETTVSEWDLVCDRQYLDTIVNSVFCIGYFFGSLVCGPVCDWFGRKRALATFCFFYFCFALGISFAPSYEAFFALRTLTAGPQIASYITAFAYISETFPKRYRNRLVLITSLIQSLTHVLVPIVGFWLRRWRQAALFGALLGLPLAFLYPFIPESARWLLAKNRIGEAKVVVERIAKSHGATFDEEEWLEIVRSETKVVKQELHGSEKHPTVVDLFRRRRMRFVTLTVAQIWFSISCLFYGMTLNIGNFFGNPWVNGVTNSAIELIGNLSFLLAPRIGKIRLMSASLLLSGLACVSSTIVSLLVARGSFAVVILAVIGKMSTQAALLIVYNLTAELYPTPARGTGLGLGSMSARVGCSLAPFVIQLQTIVPWATQTIFGILGILSAIASLFLPEMGKSSLLRSMDEAEEFYAKELKLYNRLCGHSNEDEKKRSSLDVNGNTKELKKLVQQS